MGGPGFGLVDHLKFREEVNIRIFSVCRGFIEVNDDKLKSEILQREVVIEKGGSDN